MNPLMILTFMKGAPRWVYYVAGALFIFYLGYEFRDEMADRRAMEAEIKVHEASRQAEQERIADEEELDRLQSKIAELRNEITDSECLSADDAERLRKHLNREFGP